MSDSSPIASLEPQGTQTRQPLPLASRLSRLFAAILDQIVVGLLALPIVLTLGLVNTDPAQSMEEAMTLMPEQFLALVGSHLLVWVMVNSYLLWYYGQTIGKRMMKIAMVDAEDRVPSYFRLVGLRYALIQLLSFIPLFSLLDILFIFRADRRCIHDFVAQTRVVDVSSLSSGARQV